MPLIPRIENLKDELTGWRRDIHAHPELGFQEQRTSDVVAKKLAEFGVEVHRGVGKTGADGVRRDPALIMASEDFSFMLNEVPGCYINIGNGDGEGACEVHNPSYDFNDQALPYGASFFARLVEKRLSK